MIHENTDGLGEQKCKRCGVVVDVSELVQLPLGGGQICEACDVIDDTPESDVKFLLATCTTNAERLKVIADGLRAAPFSTELFSMFESLVRDRMTARERDELHDALVEMIAAAKAKKGGAR